MNLHRNCWRCRDLDEVTAHAAAEALAYPGACMHCGRVDCYHEKCLDKKTRQLREFAQSISPDHWSQPLIAKREQIAWIPTNPFPGIQ